MKKTIVMSVLAIGLSVATINAKPVTSKKSTLQTESAFKVNAFCVSIAKGDLETVKKLLDRGENANQKSNGMTPAMYAAKFNRSKILHLLIKKGANLEAKSDKGYTALSYAKMHGAKEAQTIIEASLKK
ncbi:MAG: ankyrin repeat domain-containing protein [Aestuariibaculum sp.]